MKKILLLCAIFLPASLTADITLLKINGISVKKSEKAGYTLTTQITLPPKMERYLDTKSIEIPVERLILKGKIEKSIINERDFLYSQRSVDLNRNGSFKGNYRVKQQGHLLIVNRKKIFPYMSKRRYKNFTLFEQKYMIQKFAKKGEPLVLYESNPRDRSMTLGIGTASHPLSIKKIPNPSLQVMVAAKVDTIKEKPAFKIEGSENFVSFTNQQLFRNQADSWAAIVWTAFPLKMGKTFPVNQTKKIFIENISPPFIIFTFINCTIGGETRIRSQGRIFRVEK